jgi:hypothetical protein
MTESKVVGIQILTTHEIGLRPGSGWQSVSYVFKFFFQNVFPLLISLQVSFYTFTAPLASSMMASGLPQVSHQFHITNVTIEALTLSIFLLSFGIGVCII